MRLVLALDTSTENRLMTRLLDAGHEILARAANAAQIIDGIAAGAELVLVGATRRQLSAALIATCDERGVRIIAFAGSIVERRYAASLGLHEVMDAVAPWAEIESLLAGVLTVPPRARRSTHTQPPQAGPPHLGSVIAVWGPAGAPGRTTLAINLAAEIAAAGHSVVLADADTYSGSVAPALGILDEAPGFAAACRLAGTDSLNISEFERLAQRYASPYGAFHVLTGLARGKRWPELSADRVTAALSCARRWMDYIVVDTGFNLESDEEISSDLFAPRRNAATLAALGEADHVVAVGVADPVGMSRFLRAHADLVELLDGRPVNVIINKIRSSALGPSPYSQVATTLKRFAAIDSPILVPWDQHGVDSAMLAGGTLRDSAPRSPARIAISRFVQTSILPRQQAEKSRRRSRFTSTRTGP